MKYKSHRLSAGLTMVVVFLVAAQAFGHDDPVTDADYIKNISRTLSVGLAVGYERFDTNFKFTDKQSGRSVYVDGEGTLGLPEADFIPILYGYWKPAKRHGLGFSYFQIRRESTLLAVDENFSDLTVTGNVSLSDRSRFYYLSYNYTALQDDRALVLLSLGLYGLDMKYELDATGDISYRGVPIIGGEFSREESVFAPLPLVGLDAWFTITPRWALGSKIALVGGKYKDVSGTVVEAKIRGKYAFNRNLSLFFGVNYFQGDIEIDKEARKTDISYGFEGFFAGLDVGF
jgi:hypothetical protein